MQKVSVTGSIRENLNNIEKNSDSVGESALNSLEKNSITQGKHVSL